MKLVIGLGNPGFKYKYTRHNIGFLVLDKLAEKYQVKFDERKFSSRIARTKMGRGIVVFLKPRTYMNLSGKAAAGFLKKSKVSLKNLLVICDDVNLNFTAIRIRPKGSSGGHNGLKSIIEYFGTENFPRLRLGVGPAPSRAAALERYVLGQFNRKEQELLDDFVDNAVQACHFWLSKGIDEAMSGFNAHN